MLTPILTHPRPHTHISPNAESSFIYSHIHIFTYSHVHISTYLHIHKVRLPQLTHFPSLHSPLLSFLSLTFSITVLCLAFPCLTLPLLYLASPPFTLSSLTFLPFPCLLLYTRKLLTYLPTYLQPLPTTPTLLYPTQIYPVSSSQS